MILDAGIAEFYRNETYSDGNMPKQTENVYARAWYGELSSGWGFSSAGYGFSKDSANGRKDTARVDARIRILASVTSELRADDFVRLSGRDNQVFRILEARFGYDEDAGENVFNISLERFE